MAYRDADGLHPADRPQEEHDHLGRRERLSVRGRGRRSPRIPDVKDVAVHRLAPTTSGASAWTAAVVRRDGARPDAADLIAWSKERLAGYKRPRSIIFLKPDEMPRNATGKILHRVLGHARLSAPPDRRATATT
jgi:acyl-CoA synthetase (AMP-forming)/AMP-acid ligase II